jgi:hypothetical protein
MELRMPSLTLAWLTVPSARKIEEERLASGIIMPAVCEGASAGTALATERKGTTVIKNVGRKCMMKFLKLRDEQETG